jgi:SAM-dependent methyltransferase
MVERQESSRGIWDQFWEKGPYTFPKEHPALLGTILEAMEGDVGGKRIIEVGSGRACDLVYLAEMGAKVFLVDFSPKSFEISIPYAQQKGVTVFPLNSDARALPFADNSVDLVFSQGLIEHYEPPDRLMEEQVRVVKKGGFVLVDVPQLISIQTPVKKILMKTGKWSFGWERDYTEGQLRDLLESFGLKVVTTYAWGWAPPVGLIKGMINNAKRSTGVANRRPLNVEGGFRRSWLARHTLDCIGMLGQKI